MVNSVYASWRAQWSDAFSTSAGLRMENTHSDGHLTDTGERTKRNYTDLFPNISLSLDLPRGNQSISLDIERYTSRAQFYRLNPFARWTSNNTYTKGNPYLNPSHDWFVMLYYSFLRDFTFYIQHIRHDRSMMEYTYSDNDGNTISSVSNNGKSRYWGCRIQYNRTFWRIYDIRVETGGSKDSRQSLVNGDFIQYSKAAWNFGIQNTIFLPKHGIQLILAYNINSPSGTLTKERDKWDHSLFFEAYKSFKNGLNVSFIASGLLDTKNPVFYNSPDYSYNLRRLTSLRRCELRVSYRFGKQRVRGAKESDRAELERRLSR